jgi:hypothetical protein
MDNDKDFIGKVADVANEVADSIAKTTSELYQKGKTQVELARIRSDIRDSYRALGAVCYAIEKGGEDDGERASIIEKLDGLNDKLKEIEAARAAEKEAKASAKAARENPRGPIEVRFTGERCVDCGEPRIGTLPYCAYCGAGFADKRE